jgi:hypothetical protein
MAWFSGFSRTEITVVIPGSVSVTGLDFLCQAI